MQTTHAPTPLAPLGQPTCTQGKPVYLAVSVNPHTQVLQVSCSFVPAPGAPATVAEALALDLVNAAHKRGATVVPQGCAEQTGFIRGTLEAIRNMQHLPAASEWIAVSDHLPPQAQQPAPLKDHEIAQLVNRLRDIAITFHAAGQLRERIAAEVRTLYTAPQAQPLPTLADDTFADKAIAQMSIALADTPAGTLTNAVQLLVRPTDVRSDESGAHPGESFVMATILQEEVRAMQAALDADWADHLRCTQPQTTEVEAA